MNRTSISRRTARFGTAASRPGRPSAWRRMLPVVVLAIGVVVPGSVLAAAPPKTAVAITLHPPTTATIGADVIVGATIRRLDGGSPLGLRVGLFANNAPAGGARADASGSLSFRIHGAVTEVAGIISLLARFDGATGLLPATTTGLVPLRPAHIQVTTIPAVPGLPVTVGTESATTGADGIATVNVSKTGPYQLQPQLDRVANPDMRVSFVRWGDNIYTPGRAITVNGDANYVLGLRTAVQASIRFVDLDGLPVAPGLITRARFTSSTGDELALTSYGSTWWVSGTAVSRTGGLQASPTLWRLAEVEIAGTNVVNQGQQAFSPTVNGIWTINLLLYDLTVRPRDMLTGGPVGRAVVINFPDGSSRTVPLGSDGSATILSLPRGAYTVQVKASGITPRTPIALSRSQEVEIRVISTLDIAVFVTLGFAVLAGLLLIGRRRQLGRLARLSFAPIAGARRQVAELRHFPADVSTVEAGQGAAALGFLRAVLAPIGRRIGPALSVGRRAATVPGHAAVASPVAATTEPPAVAAAGPAASEVPPEPAATAAVQGAAEPHAPEPTEPATPPVSAPAEPPATEEPPASIEPAPPAGSGRAKPSLTKPAAPGPKPPEPAVPVAAPLLRTATRPLALTSEASGSPAPAGATATTTARDWFDAGEPGPTHPCPQCQRPVPDGHRYCIRCGHVQP